MKQNVLDVLHDAAVALAYAAYAPRWQGTGANMREVMRETVRARAIVETMLAALETIVELERRGGSSQSIRMAAVAAIKRAKGEEA
jgi:hypothetical protein